MITKNLHSIGFCVITALAASASASMAQAQNYSVTGPIVQGNLAIYPIHGRNSVRMPMGTLDAALAAGTAKVVNSENGLTIDNMSATALFVPFGSLLKGGDQDQVVATSLLVPPHSGPVYLDTYCVDPFRSTPRFGQPSSYRATHLRIPSQTARLGLLTGTGSTKVFYRMRQATIWWSLETIETRLASSLRHNPVGPAASNWTPSHDPRPYVQLHDRAGTWANGLPDALEDPALRPMQRRLLGGLAGRMPMSDDLVGAAFAINGHWVGAEIEGSHHLFEQLWPSMLQSFGIESLVESDRAVTAQPDAAAMQRLLGSAKQNSIDVTSDGSMTTYDDGQAIRGETVADGHIVQTTYVPKADPAWARQAPEVLLVGLLDKGSVNGRQIGSLDEAPVIRRDSGRADRASDRLGRWTASSAPVESPSAQPMVPIAASTAKPAVVAAGPAVATSSASVPTKQAAADGHSASIPTLFWLIWAGFFSATIATIAFGWSGIRVTGRWSASQRTM